MQFMSAEHVAAMNAVLSTSQPVKAACAALGAPRVLRYDLADGPGGEEVHWTLTIDDSMHFSLDKATTPDLVFIGDWSQMIHSARAGRVGQASDAGIFLEGDPEILSEIAPVLELARSVAALPVDFPKA